MSGAFVKIGFFRTESDLAYHDEVRGDLFAQVATAVELLQTKYLKAAIRYEGIQRVEEFPVPDAALREALLNALVHRDYAAAAPVQIRVFDDRLAIWNPAVLPEGWSLADLLREHPSVPFNPNVANAFFRAGEIEAWGRGIERIFAACKTAGTPTPRLRVDAGLWTEFPFSKKYLRLIRGTGEVTGEVTKEVRLLRLMTTDLARQAIQAGLHLKHEDHFREAYLLPALERGLIEMTIPDKPTSRLQKYRITEAGRTLLRGVRKGDGQP